MAFVIYEYRSWVFKIQIITVVYKTTLETSRNFREAARQMKPFSKAWKISKKKKKKKKSTPD